MAGGGLAGGAGGATGDGTGDGLRGTHGDPPANAARTASAAAAAALGPAVAGALRSHPEVDAAWLVGSQASGRARPDSDVDVAVLFGAGVSAERSALRRGTLMDELGVRIGRPVDVVDVERVSPRVFASVMRESRLLVDRNPQRRLDALARQYALWHDMQPHYRLQREATRRFFS